MDVVLQMQLARFAVNWNEATLRFQLTMHWTWFYAVRMYLNIPKMLGKVTHYMTFVLYLLSQSHCKYTDKWVLEFEADQT